MDAHLASAKYLGAFDMLSMPPAMTTSLMPNWIVCDASITAGIGRNKRRDKS